MGRAVELALLVTMPLLVIGAPAASIWFASGHRKRAFVALGAHLLVYLPGLHLRDWRGVLSLLVVAVILTVMSLLAFWFAARPRE